MPLFLLLIFLSFSVGGNEMDTAILPWSERSENKLDRQKEFSQVPDNFRLIDQNGIMHSLYDYLDKKNVILIPYNQTCVLSKASHYIIDSATKSLDDRIQIIFLSPDVVRNSTDSAEKIIILNDYAQFVLKQYDLNSFFSFANLEMVNGRFSTAKSSDDLITNLYRMQNSSSKFNLERTFNVYAFRLLSFLNSKLKICAPTRSENAVVFDSNLARIVFNNCVLCHKNSKTSDIFHSPSDFAKWQEMNLKTIRTMRMPPKGIDYLDSTKNHYSVYDKISYPDHKELKKIYTWIQQGAQTGPDQNNVFEKMWQSHYNKRKSFRPLARTDEQKLELKMNQPHTVPASGAALWKGVELIGPTKVDLFVTGFYLNANLASVHHTNILYLPKKLKDWPTKKSDFAEIPLNTMGDGRELILSTFSRRDGYDLLPDGTHYFIPKGSYIVALFHYSPNGKVEKNQAKITLFHKPNALQKGSKEVVRLFSPRKEDFIIPAQTKDIKFQRVLDITEDAEIIRVSMHGHFRLKSTRVFLVDPSGNKTSILNVPFYQFKFQTGFQLLKPIFVEKGSKIIGEFTYDNTSLNPANPDASKTVKLGSSTYESEMAVFRVHYTRKAGLN